MELWTGVRPVPGRARRVAQIREDEGWDGITFTDSQCLSGDVFVAMTTAAMTTSDIMLATGVTNPATRHPTVTAAAIASVNAEAGGRACLGVGRGDSSLSNIGAAPAGTSLLASYLRRVHTLLSGGETPFYDEVVPAIDQTLPHLDRPQSSKLHWLTAADVCPPVPVFLVASGPQVIRIGAALADRVTLAVGANSARVRWGIEIARAVNPGIPIGAYVNVVVDDDVERAWQSARARVAVFARFAAMHGSVHGPVAEEELEVMRRVAASYQLTRHSSSLASHNIEVTDKFCRTFAVFGPPGYCAARLRELIELGVDRLHIVGPSTSPQRQESRRRFVREVMPRLRER
jgi:5,10-methylenetetrahydromethanopterin reductase